MDDKTIGDLQEADLREEVVRLAREKQSQGYEIHEDKLQKLIEICDMLHHIGDMCGDVVGLGFKANDGSANVRVIALDFVLQLGEDMHYFAEAIKASDEVHFNKRDDALEIVFCVSGVWS